MHLVCPACSATNRIAAERLRDSPVCGKCGTELMRAKPVDISDAALPKFLAKTGAGGFLGGVVRSMPSDGTAV